MLTKNLWRNLRSRPRILQKCNPQWLTSSSDTDKAGTHTMETDSYHQTSIHQYDAHTGCQHLLEGVLERLAKRIAFENQHQEDTQRRHIADLGAADGANSMRTLQFAIHTLKTQLDQQQTSLPPLKVTLEEHPASDKEYLQTTINSYQEWFQSNQIQPSILMKSFYEPLFPPASIDLMMSYICLHWLDSSEIQSSVSEWKAWADPETWSNFVFMNECTAPKEAQERWRKELAMRHLAKFLALRAQELKPGSEGVLMMVGAPHGFICPPTEPAVASPLTLALQTCVEQGLVREQVLKQAFVPYYIRTVDDAREAMELAATIPIPGGKSKDEVEYPGAFLSLVDVLAYPVTLGKQTSENLGSFQGTFDMAWAIHVGAIRGAGATETEVEAIRNETRRWMFELYDREQGFVVTYLACVIRRRTRKAWSSK